MYHHKSHNKSHSGSEEEEGEDKMRKHEESTMQASDHETNLSQEDVSTSIGTYLQMPTELILMILELSKWSDVHSWFIVSKLWQQLCYQTLINSRYLYQPELDNPQVGKPGIHMVLREGIVFVRNRYNARRFNSEGRSNGKPTHKYRAYLPARGDEQPKILLSTTPCWNQKIHLKPSLCIVSCKFFEANKQRIKHDTVHGVRYEFDIRGRFWIIEKIETEAVSLPDPHVLQAVIGPRRRSTSKINSTQPWEANEKHCHAITTIRTMFPIHGSILEHEAVVEPTVGQLVDRFNDWLSEYVIVDGDYLDRHIVFTCRSHTPHIVFGDVERYFEY